MRSPLTRLTLMLACIASPAGAEHFVLSNHRVFIDARVNGVPTEALLDSAAEATLVDRQFATSAHLPPGEPITIRGSGGKASARVVEGIPVEALGLVVHPEAVVITDLQEISRRLAKRRIQMVAGREIFDAARLRISFSARTIETVQPAFRPKGVELPLTRHAGVESIPVTADGIPAQAEFDLGNGTEVLISRAFSKRLHLKPAGTSIGGGIGGARRRTLVELDRLAVAGLTFWHVRAAIDEQPNANDLNIGTKILEKFEITTDFANRQVWLRTE